jgi:hypothetical protein
VRRIGLVIFIVYIVIGIFVAKGDGYFKGIDDLQSVVSAALGLLLWPLVLLGVDLHIGGIGADKKGGGGKDKKGGGGKGVLVPFALWRIRQRARGLKEHLARGSSRRVLALLRIAQRSERPARRSSA